MIPTDVDDILQEFNNFHKSIQFTVDKFENCVPHFLDLEVHRDGLSIYRKDTHTAQFTHYDSHTKWNHKIAWIRSLVNRAKKLCSPNKVATELKNIKKFASYNGFPKWIVRSVIQALNKPRRTETDQNQEDVDSTILYMSLPYSGKEAESIVRRSKKRLSKLFKKEKNVKFNIFFQSTKISFFTSNKDRTPLLSSSSVIYQYNCAGCGASYVGKTENTLFNRTKEHGWKQKDSAIHQHLDTCEAWKDIVGFLQMFDSDVDKMQLQINTVRENTKVIRRSNNWLTLAFLESLAIKELKPKLNKGLKSCKELSLF